MRRALLVGTISLAAAATTVGRGETVPATFTLVPQSGSTNLVTIRLDLYSIFDATDTDTSIASGALHSNLEINFDPVTRAPTTTGIAFVPDAPGQVSFTDMNFVLNVFLVGQERVDTFNLKGTLATEGVGPVNGTTVPMDAHDVTLNGGTIDYEGIATGTLDLTAEPVSADATGTGTLTVTKVSDGWTSSNYTAVLSIPFAFSDEVLSGTTPVPYTVDLTASGTLVANSTFTQAFTPTVGYWDTSSTAGLQGGSGNWGVAAASWSVTPAGNNPRLNWFNGVQAIFNSASAATITVLGTVEANGMRFSGANHSLSGGTIELSGGPIQTETDTTIHSTLIGGSGLTKTGPGTLTLTHANTYTGTTNVNAGMLAVSNTAGSATGNGSVNIAANATLGGKGTVLGPVNAAANSTIQPYNFTTSIGTLSLLGGLTLNNTNLNFDASSLGASDLIQLGSGALNANGVSTFTIVNLLGFEAGVYPLIDYGTFSGSLANFTLASTMLAGFNLSLGDTGSTIVLNVNSPGPSQWVGAGGANWTAEASWSDGVVPNSATATANFLGMGGSPANLNASQSVNALVFNSPTGYTLTGVGPTASVLSLAGTNPTISVVATNAGTQTISTRLNLGNNTAITVDGGTLAFALPTGATSTVGTNVTATIGAGDTLRLGGAVSALGSTLGNKAKITTGTSTSTLSVTGTNQVVGRVTGPTSGPTPNGAVTGNTTVAASADVTVSGLRQNTLTLAAGTAVTPTKLAVAQQGGASGLVVLDNTVANGGSGGPALALGNDSAVDIYDNDIVLYYNSPGPNGALTTQIQGYIDNFYQGNTGVPAIASQGIIATGGETVFVAIDNALTGFGDAAVPATFYDLTLGDSGAGSGFNQVIVRYTWGGDYDLNGVVDALDYAIVDANLGNTVSAGGVAGWQLGDGDFDGMITALDYAAIDANLGKGGPLGGTAISAIPEPSTWVLGSLAAVGLGALGMRRKRRV